MRAKEHLQLVLWCILIGSVFLALVFLWRVEDGSPSPLNDLDSASVSSAGDAPSALPPTAIVGDRSQWRATELRLKVVERTTRRPIPSAIVRNATGSVRVDADSMGCVTISLSPDTDRLQIEKAGFHSKDVIIEDLDTTSEDVVVALASITELSGLVCDEQRIGVMGCRVSVVGGGGRRFVFTDEVGKFRIDGLRGRHCLIVTPPTGKAVWRSPASVTVSEGDQQVRIMLERELRGWSQLQLSAVDAEDARPLEIRQCIMIRARASSSVFLDGPDAHIEGNTAVFDAVAPDVWLVELALADGRMAFERVDLRGSKTEV